MDLASQRIPLAPLPRKCEEIPVMEVDLTLYFLAGCAVLIAGISKGGFGGGLAFMATPLLALTVTPVQAAAIMLPVLIMIDQIGMISYWRKWRWDVVWPILVAGTVGVGLGCLAFGRLSADMLRLGLGLIALGFLAFQIAQKQGWKPHSEGSRQLRASIWGTACGFTSMISHAGGPPVTIYLLGEKLQKTAYQASAVLIFAFINMTKLGAYSAIGVLDASILGFSAKLFPVALIGVLIGVWAHKHVPEWLFFRLLVILLALTGAKLVWDGLNGILA